MPAPPQALAAGVDPARAHHERNAQSQQNVAHGASPSMPMPMPVPIRVDVFCIGMPGVGARDLPRPKMAGSRRSYPPSRVLAAVHDERLAGDVREVQGQRGEDAGDIVRRGRLSRRRACGRARSGPPSRPSRRAGSTPECVDRGDETGQLPHGRSPWTGRRTGARRESGPDKHQRRTGRPGRQPGRTGIRAGRGQRRTGIRARPGSTAGGRPRAAGGRSPATRAAAGTR